MADIFDDMLETIGEAPDAEDSIRNNPAQPGAKAQAREKTVPQDNISLADAKAQAAAVFAQAGKNLDDEIAKDSVLARQELVQKVYQEAEKNTPFFEKLMVGVDDAALATGAFLDKSTAGRIVKGTVKAPVEVSAGLALGAQKAFWSGINAFKEAYNGMGKLAEDHGIVEKFEPTEPIDFSGFIDKNYPETTKVVSDIGQAISPAVAAGALATGPVSLVAGAAVGTYLLMDPKGTGLAELFKDTAVGKTMLLEDAFALTEKKPDDSPIVGRLKNVADFAFGEALIGGAVAGIKGLFKGGKALKPYVMKTPNAVDDIPTGVTTEAPAVPKAEVPAGAAPAVEPPAVVAPKPVVIDEAAEQLDLEAWVKSLDTAQAKPMDVQLTAKSIIESNPAVYGKRPPQTIPGMISEAQVRVATPGWLDGLIQKRLDDPTSPIPAEDSLALDLEILNQTARSQELTQKAIITGADLDIMAAKEGMDYVVKLQSVKEAVASEAGRTLGITEGITRAVQAGTSNEALQVGLKILGNQGRNKLLQDYLATYGGKRPIMEQLKMTEIINNIPDARFADEAVSQLQASNNMKKVVKQTGFRKFTDAAYQVYTNSLLSIKTVGNVYVLNQAQTAFEVADHYMRTMIGKIPGIGSGQGSIQEAHAFASGFIQAQKKGHALAMQALREGKSPRGFAVNGDFTSYSKDIEAATQNSVWGMLFDKGMGVATIPGRVIMSADVVSKYVNEYAFLNSYAIEEGMTMAKQMNIPKEQVQEFLTKFTDDFMANPSNKHLQRAKEQAEKLTQSRDITNVPGIGKVAEFLEEDPTGLLRFLFPFFRTSVNTVSTALERLPILNLITKEARDGIRQGGKARDMVMAKVVNGSLFTFGMYELWQRGILTGPMPNPKQQQALADEGKGVMPHSLNLSEFGLGSYYIRGLDPIGKVLRLFTTYAAVRDGQEDMEFSDYLSTAGALAFSQFTPEYLGQYDALIDAISGKDATRIKQWVATVGANTLVPLRGSTKQISQVVKGLMDEEGKVAQTVARGDTDDFLDFFTAQLQDTIGYGLPEKKDIFNRPIKQHWLTAVNPFASQDTANSELGAMLRTLGDFEGKLARAGFKPAFSIEMPSKRISIAGVGNIELGADEYDDLIALMNKPSSQGLTMEQEVTQYLKETVPILLAEANNFVSPYSTEQDQLNYKAILNGLDKIFSSREEDARSEIIARPSVILKLDKLMRTKKPTDTSSVSIFGGPNVGQ